MLEILEATQAAYGYLPVAALKRISHVTGAWYAMIYGTASYYAHLRFEPPTARDQAAAVEAHRPAEASYLTALGAALEGGGRPGRRRAPDRGDAPQDPGCLAAHPPRPRGRQGPDRPRRRRPRRCVHGPPARDPRGGWPGHDRHHRASGLRGRGGAGYPTGDKWRTAAETPADRRYVVANGYGADPASHTDRTMLVRDPYAVIEGTAIAAFAIGASEAFIAVRAEDANVVARLSVAIGAATDAGFLGPDVLGSGHDLFVTVRPVQGAYMLGEETVLLKALEGKRGQPEQRPPHPAERGLFDRPTVVNNVQTLAAVPWILREGPEAFRATGTPRSPGTVLVQVRTPGKDGHRGGPVRDEVARHHRAGRQAPRRPQAPGRARRRPVGRAAPARRARHAVRVRGAPRGGRPPRFGVARRRR